jgi:hypothetical protein
MVLMHDAGTRSRWLNAANITLLMLSVLTLLVVVNVFAQRPELRSRIDATKTRAYSLSEQTMRLLDSLEGEWTIALVMVEERVDRTIRRQIDEVLDRYVRASPNITVQKIDPTDPRSLADYESLIARLRTIYRNVAEQYEHHLDHGSRVFEELLLFARQESGDLDQLAQVLDPDAPGVRRFAERTRMMGLLADQGETILNEIHKARQITDARPIPDYDTAQSVLVQALSQSANELFDMAEVIEEWIEGGRLERELREFLSPILLELQQWTQRLARAVDPLMHLPPLELSIIGETLAEGEAVVIIGPTGATVIPSQQLFPMMMNFRRERGPEGMVRLDQRFRGEQLLSAAMRSLTVEHMPKVTFVHAEPQSLLRPRDRNVDLYAMAVALNASRFEVDEWLIDQMEKPQPRPGQPAVWVVVPPAARPGLEPPQRELDLISAVRELLEAGEPVLLSVYPSQLPRYGQTDPWSRLAEKLDMSVDTAQAIFESVRSDVDHVEVQRGLAVQSMPTDHVIARAVHGQQIYFSLPVPIMPFDDISQAVRWSPLVIAEPAANRWLEPNWHADTAELEPAPSERRLQQATAMAMAIERPNPAGPGEQRTVLVGAGGWMLSFVADAAVPIGGERMALTNPGNRELLLASVAWLAGMDDLVAQSPMSQEVARLGEVSDAWLWRWAIVLGLPALSLAAGLCVWGVRRA